MQEVIDLVQQSRLAGLVLTPPFSEMPHIAEALEKIVKEELNDEIDVCLSLVVEDKILVERLLKRGEISGRSDDSNVEIIENRIKEYYAKTAEVAELYKQQGKYVEINGVGDIDEISEKLFAEVEKVQK